MKTTNDITELVFILDRSGSMCGLESDTIGGFNSTLEKQKKECGKANVSVVLFDDKYELIHDRTSIDNVKPLTENEYYVRGSTALCDAIGISVSRMTQTQKLLSEDEKAKKVLFVIITDGMENSSREYSINKVRSLIETQREKYNWEFLFLGANIDAVKTAGGFGIAPEMAADYVPDGMGTQLNFSAVSDAISDMRAGGNVSRAWSQPIRNDFKRRARK